jgi:hypothetical protein
MQPSNNMNHASKPELSEEENNEVIPLPPQKTIWTNVSTLLLSALDLAESSTPPSLNLQRRAPYRPVGAFAMAPGRTPQSRATLAQSVLRSGGGGGGESLTAGDADVVLPQRPRLSSESNDDDDDSSSHSDRVRRSSSIFHVPVANLVVETTNNETNLSSSVSALTNDTTNTTSAAAAPQTTTTTATDIEIAQEVYSGTFMPPTVSTSDLDGNSERATKTNDTETLSAPRNAPYCSRLFYTLLCLALLVLIIVFIVLGITILKDGGPKPEQDRLPPPPPPPPRLPPPLPPTLSPVVGAASTNNDTDSTNTTTDST